MPICHLKGVQITELTPFSFVLGSPKLFDGDGPSGRHQDLSNSVQGFSNKKGIPNLTHPTKECSYYWHLRESPSLIHPILVV